MKKIALCFAGQPRHIIESYNFIKNNIINPNNISDIFVHTWWRPEWSDGKIFENIRRPNHFFDPKSLDTIKKFYSPKKMLVEDDRDYHDFINKTFINNSNYVSEQKHNIINTYPKYLSMTQSNRLKNEYEEENGFEYDIVVRLRFDFCPFIIIKVDEYDLSVIHTPTIGPNSDSFLGTISDALANDCFAIANKKNMDFYCEVTHNLLEVAKRRPQTSAEGTLGYHLLDNNIPVKFSWIDRKQMDIFRNIKIL